MSGSPKKPRANKQAASSAPEEQAEVEALQDNPIDQVRNILFGAEIQQQKDETTRLEQNLRRTLDQLQTDTNKRFADLTNLLQEQVTMLQQSQHAESAARKDEEARLESLLRQLIDDLDTKTDKSFADLSATLEREVERLTQHIDRRSQELTKQLDDTRAALERNKADRTLVASVLKTAAAELERGD